MEDGLQREVSWCGGDPPGGSTITWRDKTVAETWTAPLPAAEMEGRERIQNTEAGADKTGTLTESGRNTRVCTRNASPGSAMKRERPFELHVPLS